jgi:hypothetical protein
LRATKEHLLLATGTNDDVLEPPIVLQTTLGAAPDPLGLVRLLGNLRGLATHLSCTRKRSVNLNSEVRNFAMKKTKQFIDLDRHLSTRKRNSQGESRLSLNTVVSKCAQVIQNAAITAKRISRRKVTDRPNMKLH